MAGGTAYIATMKRYAEDLLTRLEALTTENVELKGQLVAMDRALMQQTVDVVIEMATDVSLRCDKTPLEGAVPLRTLVVTFTMTEERGNDFVARLYQAFDEKQRRERERRGKRHAQK